MRTPSRFERFGTTLNMLLVFALALAIIWLFGYFVYDLEVSLLLPLTLWLLAGIGTIIAIFATLDYTLGPRKNPTPDEIKKLEKEWVSDRRRFFKRWGLHILMGTFLLSYTVRRIFPDLPDREVSALVRSLACLGATATILIAAAIPFLYRRKRRRRFRKGLCLNCGYNLHAHKTGQRCPECGSTILSKPQDMPRL